MQSRVGMCQQVCSLIQCGPGPCTKCLCISLRTAHTMLLADSPLEHTASTMTDAVIRFELLATELNSPVKLSLGAAVDGSQCKAPGSFVLYNYARMCTVLANFDKAVASGRYNMHESVWRVDIQEDTLCRGILAHKYNIAFISTSIHALDSMYVFPAAIQWCPVLARRCCGNCFNWLT